MNTDQIELFIDVAKTGSINKTAANFFITHQSASSSLKKLESELGMLLLNRTPGGISLTEDGQYVLSVLQNIYEQYTDLKFLKHRTLKSTITMQFPAIYTLISQNKNLDFMFLQHFPNIGVITQIADNDTIINEARYPEKSYLYIFYTFSKQPPFDESLANESFYCHCFYKDQLCIAAQKSHPLTIKKKFSTKILDNFPLVIYQPYIQQIEQDKSYFGIHIKKNNIAYTPSTLNALLNVLKNSNAVSPLPKLFINSLSDSEKEDLAIIYPTPPHPIYWWYVYSRQNAQQIQDCITLFTSNTLNY